MVMSAPPAWSQVEAAFQKIWGYERFRPPQDTVIRALLAQQDLLAVMPTGGGKSICFQLPALLQSRTTLVVSPLVALMENQVAELRERDLPAAVIHGDLDRFAKQRTLQAVAQNRLRLLYLSPETLLSPSVWQVLCQPQVTLNGLILDEAHCLVQWGETFRPAYRRLGVVRSALLQHRPPGTTLPIAAFTATANPAAQQTLETVLGLSDPLRICLSPYRNNLHLAIKTVWTPKGRQRALVKFLQNYPGQSGLVYVRTRRVAETLADDLTRLGYNSLAYHAGLVAARRRRIEADWIAGTMPIVVCTSAFGMGINKPDVRFVAHYQAPGTLSEYIQEVGRGGRDGQRADALTLVSERTGWFDTSDRQRQQFFAQQQQQQIRQAHQLMKRLPKAGNIQELARHNAKAPMALSILHTTGQLTWQDPFHYRIEAKGQRVAEAGEAQAAKEMARFLYGKGCRWQGLLRAFGCEAEAERMGGCGHCDRCQAK
ncbi:MAG: RecQ family ATP-dependent DNA helicase [Cyanobacteria bacterium J06632_22]